MYPWGGRRTLITESLAKSDLLLLNLDSPTRIPSYRDPTFLDLTIALDSEWRTLTANNLPIIVQLGILSK